MGKFFFRFFTGMHAKLYKLTGGRFFGGGSIIVVTHQGAKSGKVRETPLMAFREGADYLIVASAGGAPSNPGWYYNLLANAETIINDGGDEVPVTARDAGSDRDALWEKVVAAAPRFKAYEGKTDRVIPIVVLSPR